MYIGGGTIKKENTFIRADVAEDLTKATGTIPLDHLSDLLKAKRHLTLRHRLPLVALAELRGDAAHRAKCLIN